MASDAADGFIRCVVRTLGNHRFPDDRSGRQSRRMASDIPAFSDRNRPRCDPGQFGGAGGADCDLYVAKGKGKAVYGKSCGLERLRRETLQATSARAL